MINTHLHTAAYMLFVRVNEKKITKTRNTWSYCYEESQRSIWKESELLFLIQVLRQVRQFKVKRNISKCGEVHGYFQQFLTWAETISASLLFILSGCERQQASVSPPLSQPT